MSRGKPRRRGHLRQRGNSWVVTYRDSESGRQTWRSFKTRELAELELARVQVALAKGEARAPRRVKFEDAAEAWLDSCRDRGLAPSTLRDRRSVLDHWLLPAFEGKPLDQVTAAAVTKWRRDKMRQTKVRIVDGRKVEVPVMTRRTAEKLTALLYSVFEFAKREYAVPANPIESVERITISYDPSRFDFYSPEEALELFRSVEDDQDRAIYTVCAFAGLRLSECLATRWRDVDFAAHTLRVEQALDGVGGFKSPKGRVSRAVPMLDAVAAALDGLSQRERFTGPDDLVFVGESGGPLDGSALRRRYKAAQVKAGARKIRFHDLRHSFGTTAANAALSGHELQSWMGHRDYRTTQRYLHYRARGDEARRLNAAFTPTSIEESTGADEAVETASELQANTLHDGAAAFHLVAAGSAESGM